LADSDERIDIDAEDVQITGKIITVNSGWTPRMAMYNTIGTLAGALVGCASLVLSAIALVVAFTR